MRWLSSAFILIAIIGTSSSVLGRVVGPSLLINPRAGAGGSTSSIVFSTNPVSVADNTASGTTVTTFTQSPDTGTPAITSCSQSPCPFAVGGSTGAWKVVVANGITLVDASSQHVIVGSATLTYSITAAGAGIACVFGPNYTGPIPADVTTAFGSLSGGVQCLMNFRPSQYTNLNQFIADCGGPASPPTWFYRNFQSQNTPGSCSSGIDLENDSTLGHTVLHLHADASNQNFLFFPDTYYPYQSPNTNYFPLFFYYQMTFRFSASSLAQSFDNIVGNSFWEDTNSPGGVYQINPQLFEIDAGQSGNTTNCANSTAFATGASLPQYQNGNYYTNTNPQLPTCADYSVYHTLGALFTGDSTGLYACGYLDGVKGAGAPPAPAHCGGESPANLPNQLNAHHYAYEMGAQWESGYPNPVDEYIDSFVVLACSGSYGTTTNCYGTAVKN